jgi:ATP-binding cassette subfamily F protein uup
VRALESLRNERRARRDEPGRVKAQLQGAERSGKMVLKTKNVGFSYDGAPIVKDLSTTVLRGDRIGILGPNGCGKTTLIRLLLGELAPDHGTVTIGTRLEVAHFEQLHDVLDDTKSLLENVGEGRETVTVGGVERHIVGYLRGFLFTPEQIQGSILRLSGGERRRLQLAKLLAKPCNLLVLDEPTNDLDLETLELLEELLVEFEGTLLVVSHDRAFLDNVVTSTLVFEGDGQWSEYVGGYEDWLRQKKAAEPTPAPKPGRSQPRPAAERARKLGFNELRELTELPKTIERLEAEKQVLFARMSSPSFYADRANVARTNERLVVVERELEKAYARWMELDTLTR